MKSLKLFVAILSLSILTSFSVNANNSKPVKAKQVLRTEIVNLIGKQIPFEIAENISTEISFTVNQNNEVVVLDVNSKNKQLVSYIKSRLNYKKINSKTIKQKEIYTLPFKVNKPS